MVNKVQIPRRGQVLIRGQGTIEYLVIIGIVVVLSLVVVGIVMTQTNSSGDVSGTSSTIKNRVGVGGISIVDAAVDRDGNALLILKNLSAEDLVVNKITIDGVDYDTIGGQFVYGGPKDLSIFLEGLAVCDGTKKSYTLKIYFNSPNISNKNSDFQSVIIDCVPRVVPPVDVVETISFTCVNSSPFESGSGTLEDPFGVCSWDQLNNVRDYLDANFVLLDDLDSSSTGYSGVGDEWEPIGVCGGLFCTGDSPNFNYPFEGDFNGTSHTISNLKINLPSGVGVGLFGVITGNISNVGLIDVNVTGDTYVGGLVGRQIRGTISNSYSSGNIIGSNSSSAVGGLVGILEGIVVNSYAKGDLAGPDTTSVGGLSGVCDGSISNSYSTVNVTTSGHYVGGIAGELQGTISNSFANGEINIIESGDTSGGLVGYNSGTISNSYWDTTLTGQEDCYDGGSTDCTPTNSEASLYYGGSGIPFDELSWATDNWQGQSSDYPILTWQVD